MQIPRFFVDSSSISENVNAALIDDAKLVHQILRVLRLGKGDPVILLNGKGDLFHCRIENQDRSSIALFIESKESQDTKLAGGLTVAMPLIKPSRFEWALEKLTELGATTIIPLLTERTVHKPIALAEVGKKKVPKADNVKKDNQAGSARITRWESIVREAA